MREQLCAAAAVEKISVGEYVRPALGEALGVAILPKSDNAEVALWRIRRAQRNLAEPARLVEEQPRASAAIDKARADCAGPWTASRC